MSSVPESVYSELPKEGPYDIGIGHALITMVEPHPGHERAYNRWYEDDHYFSGAMYEPYMYSGRRWVAPRDLQLLRYGAACDAPVAEPITKGCYLGTYWVTPGRIEEHMRFTRAANNRMREEGRKFPERTLVFSEFQEFTGTVYRHDGIPRDIFALINPYPGLVLEVLDAETPQARDGLERWLLESHLPARVRAPDSPAELAMVFRTTAPRTHAAKDHDDVSNGGRRLSVLWFIDKDPHEVWAPFFGGEGEIVAGGGKGQVSFVAPFLPSKMGTDMYVDQLR